jgi:hypothetical protein
MAGRRVRGTGTRGSPARRGDGAASGPAHGAPHKRHGKKRPSPRPSFSAFTQPLDAHPTVSFPAANAPYLVGVITAAPR